MESVTVQELDTEYKSVDMHKHASIKRDVPHFLQCIIAYIVQFHSRRMGLHKLQSVPASLNWSANLWRFCSMRDTKAYGKRDCRVQVGGTGACVVTKSNKSAEAITAVVNDDRPKSLGLVTSIKEWHSISYMSQ